MKVVVSGASGFIGRHAVNSLIQAGHEVIALSRGGNPPVPGVTRWVQCDLSRPEEWSLEADFEGVDVLLHLAASGVDPKTAVWATCFETNVTAAMRLWLAAVNAGVRRIVNCGTCFEYGSAATAHLAIPTTAAPQPLSPYAASKAAATMILHGIAASSNIQAISLRPCVVFGEGEPEHRLWPSLRRAALAGTDLPMTSGFQVRDFMPVELLAERLCEAVTREDLRAGRLLVENVGSGAPKSVREFATEWWGRWGGTGKLLFCVLPDRPSECPRMVPLIGTAERVGLGR